MFLTTLTAAHLAALAASTSICWDLETTGLTPVSRPTAVGASAKIGHLTWNAYKRLHSATLNCVVRARVSTVALQGGVVLAWDLDALTLEERRALIRATVHGKTVIGHNLGFDLTWAVDLCGPDLEPECVLDTMLLIRCLRPGMTWTAHHNAAAGDESCVEVIEDGKGNASASLAAIAAGMGIGKLDKSFQHPRNWCVSVLSPEHYEYVVGDVKTPIAVCRRIARVEAGDDWSVVCERIFKLDRGGAGGVYFRTYRHVPMMLARMSGRGMPIHTPTLEAIELDRAGKIPALVETVIAQIPAMGEHVARLMSTQSGVPAALKLVLGAYAAANGFELKESADGTPVIKAKDARLCGVTALDGWRAWDDLQHAKKIVSLCGEYKLLSRQSAVDPEFRTLHPLLGARTVTLRVASEAPNVQNLPRPQKGLDDELQFRSAVCAYPGHVIVSADYGQIELRIAAALALRTIEHAQAVCDRRLEVAPWVAAALWAGSGGVHGRALDPNAEGFQGVCDGISVAWRAVQNNKSPLAEAFRKGVDPHLLTGLGMAVMQGIVDISNETPMQHLVRIGAAGQDALKKRIGPQRQAAKALNFGLLYGMQAQGLWALGITDYGLTWTLEEAIAARAAWFDMFPEIHFWQLWMKFVAVQPKKEARDMYRRNPYTKALETVSVRLGVTHTLSGRPVVAEKPRELGNYSDQGTGADMMLDALVHLESPSRDWVMNTVHDEVLLMVPEQHTQLAQDQLQRAMLAAADRILSPYAIPAEAEPGVSKFWKKD